MRYSVSAFLLLLLIGCANTALVREQGRALAFARNKGNCLACHRIEQGEEPGNIGPPLKNLAERFKSKALLRQQIFDATQFNSETSMPPYGRNHILSAEEIDKIVDYLWTVR